MAMTAMTTSNSTSVKPARGGEDGKKSLVLITRIYSRNLMAGASQIGGKFVAESLCFKVDFEA
jgi:hypothetical protein